MGKLRKFGGGLRVFAVNMPIHVVCNESLDSKRQTLERYKKRKSIRCSLPNIELWVYL